METLNSIYGRAPTTFSMANEFSQITETSNEDTDPEIKKTEAYLSQLKSELNKDKIKEFKKLELQM